VSPLLDKENAEAGARVVAAIENGDGGRWGATRLRVRRCATPAHQHRPPAPPTRRPSPAPATLVIRPGQSRYPAAADRRQFASLGAVRQAATASPQQSPTPVANPLTVSVSPACNSATVANTALDRNGTGATGSADLLHHDKPPHERFAPAPTELLGRQ